MEKIVLIAASHQKLKYYFNPEFSNIPEQSKEEIIKSAVYVSNNLKCAFIIGYYEDGELYLETAAEDAYVFDEINAEILIERFKKEKAALIQSLTLYYKIFVLQET